MMALVKSALRSSIFSATEAFGLIAAMMLWSHSHIAGVILGVTTWMLTYADGRLGLSRPIPRVDHDDQELERLELALKNIIDHGAEKGAAWCQTQALCAWLGEGDW